MLVPELKAILFVFGFYFLCILLLGFVILFYQMYYNYKLDEQAITNIIKRH